METTTIAAISTPAGVGGIAVIRLSGPRALAVADMVWKGKTLADVPTHTAHLGTLLDADGMPLDSAVATVFRGPRSFTGEDTVEFSVHGSEWIQRKVVESLIENGAVAAEPGEFTRRAFINGRLDLAQAEAVADLIASSSRAAHRIAMRQIDGTFSSRLEELRQQLVELASLLELELDFSEEDVEFADRQKLSELTDTTLAVISRLADSYKAGRAFKQGVPVVIAGVPNAGKSTLLNALLDTEKAIVSDTPGTTRDIIEDTVEIDGMLFRFLDTAGLRDTDDHVEQIGIDRARHALGKAAIVLWLIDPTQPLAPQQEQMQRYATSLPDATILTVITKSDLAPASPDKGEPSASTDAGLSTPGAPALTISASTGAGLSTLKAALNAEATKDHRPDTDIIITNARHYAQLRAGAESLQRVREALTTSLPPDLIAQDVRDALHHLGLLTGAVTTDTLLSTIFSRFCIGK